MRFQILPILALLCGMFFMMLGVGLHGVLISIRGDAAGFSSYDLGLIGTSYAIGFMLGCILVPHLVRRVGHVRAFSALVAILTVSALLNGIHTSAVFWIILRSLSGFCISGCYMVAESWLNERSTNDARGSVFSIYTMVSLSALLAGQYMLVLDDEAWASGAKLFMICSILFVLAVVPTAVSRAQSPTPLTHVDLNLRTLFNNSPAAFIGAFLCGIISSAWVNFGPIFGKRIDMTNTEIATLLAVTIIGSVLFQYPLGRLSDKIDRRYVMVIAGFIGVASGSLMAYFSQSGNLGTLFYLSAIGYGAVIFSIYSLVIAHANDYADSGDFVQISSGMLILYGSGTVAGPLLTAFMMDILGPSGVFTTTTLTHLCFASYAFYRTFRRERAGKEDRTDFKTTGMTRTHTPESYTLDPRSEESIDTEESDLPPMPPPIKVE